jgi:hypothetical protein
MHMKKLLDLGFKKIPTEDGFVMYELSPARLPASKQPDPSRKQQASSSKQQAASVKLDKSK